MKTVNEFPAWIATVAGGLLVLSFFFVLSRGQTGPVGDANLPIDHNLVLQGLSDVHASSGVHPQLYVHRTHGGPVRVPAKLLAMMRRPVVAPSHPVPESSDQRVAASLKIAELSLAQATAALETAKAEVDRQLSVRNESALSPN